MGTLSVRNDVGYPYYSISFGSVDDGAIPDAFTGTSWTVASGKAINTALAGDESELLSNYNFATWSGDNPTGWSKSFTEDANNYVTESPAGKCRFVSDGHLRTSIRTIRLPQTNGMKPMLIYMLLRCQASISD